MGDPQNSIGIFYQNGDIVFRIYDNEVRSKVSYNKAHYIVAIYTKTSMSLYVDSVFAASLSLSNFSFTNESSAFSIGPANQYEYFIVDSAAAYRYPLTEKQINSHYTAGLNKIRTSPDHGTAYEIAGKGVANHESFKEAVYLALDIFNKRNDYLELIKNPLKTKQKQL